MNFPQIADQIIQLPSCDSTSNYIANELKREGLPFGLTVLTFSQTNGRGQRGNSWHCGEGKNIAMSFYTNSSELKMTNLFYLNKICSLAVIDLVSHYTKAVDLKIKWPNDVLLNERKIAGILVESTVQGKNAHYICGIGLNVNENEFPEAIKCLATSIAEYSEEKIELKDVFAQFLKELNYYHRLLILGNYAKIDMLYNEHLLGLNQIREFIQDGATFLATVKGITHEGMLRLQVANANQEKMLLQPKEITWVLKP